MIAAILASLVLWPMYLALSLVLDVVGLFLLVPLSLARAWRWRYSRVYAGRNMTVWRGGRLTWLWGNEEDGVAGPEWWRERTGVARYGWLNGCWSAYRWSALRNPTNNLRFVPFINPVIDPHAIRWVGRGDPETLGSWSFTWQGAYAGFRCSFRFRGGGYRLWLGWKLLPRDAQGVADTDYRKPRCGWATQFKRIS